MKNEIDLSKLAVKELPKKTIKANFDGKKKDFEIRALTDGERATLESIVRDTRNPYRTQNLYTLVLSAGLDIAPEVAALLYDRCNDEAVRVGEEIFNFSGIFDEAKTEEAEKAEKNSPAETSAQ